MDRNKRTNAPGRSIHRLAKSAVMQPKFRSRLEPAKKGRGSYTRTKKHKHMQTDK